MKKRLIYTKTTADFRKFLKLVHGHENNFIRVSKPEHLIGVERGQPIILVNETHNDIMTIVSTRQLEIMFVSL